MVTMNFPLFLIIGMFLAILIIIIFIILDKKKDK